MKPIMMQCGDRTLDLSKLQVMGILNITPDSFSDGGHLYTHGHLNLDDVWLQAEKMLTAGAHILDVGGESTRPGASPVSVNEELDRVIPVIEGLRQRFDAIISVDTSQPQVIKHAASSGAGIINDVRALTLDGALEEAVKTQLPVCLMHMQGSPLTMQRNPEYEDVIAEVKAFLLLAVKRCVQAGIMEKNIILDPGFGFGKTLRHNLTLLNRLDDLTTLGFPLLSGTSRKGMLGIISGKSVEKRMLSSVVSALLAVQKGACIVRVHDVAETVEALNIYQAMLEENWEG